MNGSKQLRHTRKDDAHTKIIDDEEECMEDGCSAPESFFTLKIIVI
jgi:hypothetical protein